MKKKKTLFKLISLVCTLSICIALFSSSVSAYWATLQCIDGTLLFIPFYGFGDTTISHFNEALYQWNSAIDMTIMRRDPTERHYKHDYPNNDNKNYIYRTYLSANDYVAQTTRYTTNDEIVSADINFNMYFNWANSANPNTYDVWTVFLHEAGHAAGLSHSAYSSSVMYPTVSTNTLKRYLSDDDRTGIRVNYGLQSTTTTTANRASLQDIPGMVNCYISGTLATYEYNDLLNYSTLIVRATVNSQSEVFQIQPVSGGDPSNFSDFTLKITDVFWGNKNTGDEITVRVQGGSTNGLNVVVEDAPDYQVGDDVLVFLYQPNMGTGYNTMGDYYYTLGLYQGAFFANTSSNINSNNTEFVNNNGTTISLNEITAASVQQARTTTSTNENRLYNDYLQSLNNNLEAGIISQEEYNQLLAESQIYATVLP